MRLGNIEMVDLKNQYLKIKREIDAAINDVIESTAFINGPAVKNFEHNLSEYLNVNHVIGCANGTDALQIAIMALGLEKGAEIIVPCFTYVATAEVIALLQLKPVLVDVSPETFNITPEAFEKAITPNTKAVVPVHLYGQCADMEQIMRIAKENKIFVIEDCAQALGADYMLKNGASRKAGTIGDIGCTSFFPSKNLGCFGDGGAILCNNDELAVRIRMIANHGQNRKYFHKVIGCNSRLDSIQAAILNAKLPFLDDYAKARNYVAEYYDKELSTIDWIEIPRRQYNSSHVFHQYTIKIKESEIRDNLKEFLRERGVPTMIYYPTPLHRQEAFYHPDYQVGCFPISEVLCSKVLSLPIHTEMDDEQLHYIVNLIKTFRQ